MARRRVAREALGKDTHVLDGGACIFQPGREHFLCARRARARAAWLVARALAGQAEGVDALHGLDVGLHGRAAAFRSGRRTLGILAHP